MLTPDQMFPRSLGKIRAEIDMLIIQSWQAHEEAEPDISTERLMAMVAADTGADVERQIQALERAGFVR